MNNTQVGGGVRSTLLIEALSKLGHVDVVSFVKEPLESSIPNCDVIFSGGTPKGVSTLNNRIIHFLKITFTPWSFKGYFSINKEQENIISHYYNANNYDFVVCHFIWEAIPCGLMRYADRLIIDVDDNFISATKRDSANAISSPFSPFFTRIKMRMLRRMQNHFLKRVKLSFYSNENDPPHKKSVFLHNVPLLTYPCLDITESTPMRILFVGNIDFFPNKEGLVHFVEYIYPIIKQRIPTVELNIVGMCKDQETKSKLSAISGVNVLGFVDFLREEYQNCRAVIVPLYHGSGTSIKFIEGIMMNRPVVSTQIGARGFNNFFHANQHYCLANSDQEFANHAVNLLSDLDNSVLMAKMAYEIGKTHFSKQSFYDVVTKSIETIS